jgi:hypothetical protein
MRSRSILWLSLVILAIWTVFVLQLGSSSQAMPSELSPEAYLPAVYRLPTPTPTPTPKPTVVPPGVHIVNDSSFTHGDTGFSVVGEVYNNTDKYLWNVKVGARFYNSSGQRVKTIKPFALDFNPVPDSRICFAMDDRYSEINWDYYEFDLEYWDDGTAPPPVRLDSVEGYPGTDHYGITGLVYNEHSGAVANLRVQARLKAEDGIVLDCRQAGFLPSVLYSGEKAAFTIDFDLRSDGYDNVDRYRVFAQADELHH